MVQAYKETCIDILRIWYHPKRTFHELMKKPITLRPLMVILAVLFLCSLISGIYLHMKAQWLLLNPQASLSQSLATITEIANTNMVQYCITIFFAPLVSILSVAIMMFVMSTFAHSNTSFKQNVILVAYAWSPMLIASIITTMFACLFPIQTSIVAKSFYDYIIPLSMQGSAVYQFLTRVDPFYIWTLCILSCGASVLYGKGGKWWYVIIFMILEMPVWLTMMSA